MKIISMICLAALMLLGCQSSRSSKPFKVETVFTLPGRVETASPDLPSRRDAQVYSIPVSPNETIRYSYSATTPIHFQIRNSKENYLFQRDASKYSGEFQAPATSSNHSIYDFVFWTHLPTTSIVKFAAHQKTEPGAPENP